MDWKAFDKWSGGALAVIIVLAVMSVMYAAWMQAATNGNW